MWKPSFRCLASGGKITRGTGSSGRTSASGTPMIPAYGYAATTRMRAGVDVLTRIEDFDFEEFFARSVPAEIGGTAVRFIAAEDVAVLSPDNDA
jgi:hypothetical protein